MVTAEKGLALAREIYQDRTRRIKELKAQGRKVIGYLDILPPLELLTAADLVPFRLLGDMKEPITKGDTCLPTVVCPFLRSVVDLGLKGRYNFLDGVVFGHPCEVAEKVAHIWRLYLNPGYAFFIDTPHTTHTSAQRQLKGLLEDFRQSLEKFTGTKLTDAKLKEAIEVYNGQRKLVKELYDLRKPDPPLVSGAEMVEVMVALASLSVEEGNELLRQIISEVTQRQDGPAQKPARLLVWGDIIDNTALIELIEQSGANVVMDDMGLGSRAYFPLVELNGKDPLEALAKRYLVDIRTPRTFRETVLSPTRRKDYQTDLQNRFGYLKDYAGEWKVNGVIMAVLRYCDIHGYEVPALREYLEKNGLPSLYLEHNYTEAGLEQLRTRVQAFLEVIG